MHKNCSQNIFCRLLFCSTFLQNKWGTPWKRAEYISVNNHTAKLFPWATDSAISTSQRASLHQTISPFRAAGNGHVSELFWSFLIFILLCQPCQLSYPFHLFPKGYLSVHPHAWKPFQIYLPSMYLNYS